jgi:hypothetical protein
VVNTRPGPVIPTDRKGISREDKGPVLDGAKASERLAPESFQGVSLIYLYISDTLGKETGLSG